MFFLPVLILLQFEDVFGDELCYAAGNRKGNVLIYVAKDTSGEQSIDAYDLTQQRLLKNKTIAGKNDTVDHWWDMSSVIKVLTLRHDTNLTVFNLNVEPTGKCHFIPTEKQFNCDHIFSEDGVINCYKKKVQYQDVNGYSISFQLECKLLHVAKLHQKCLVGDKTDVGYIIEVYNKNATIVEKETDNHHCYAYLEKWFIRGVSVDHRLVEKCTDKTGSANTIQSSGSIYPVNDAEQFSFISVGKHVYVMKKRNNIVTSVTWIDLDNGETMKIIQRIDFAPQPDSVIKFVKSVGKLLRMQWKSNVLTIDDPFDKKWTKLTLDGTKLTSDLVPIVLLEKCHREDKKHKKDNTWLIIGSSIGALVFFFISATTVFFCRCRTRKTSAINNVTQSNTSLVGKSTTLYFGKMNTPISKKQIVKPLSQPLRPLLKPYSLKTAMTPNSSRNLNTFHSQKSSLKPNSRMFLSDGSTIQGDEMSYLSREKYGSINIFSSAGTKKKY